MPGHRITATATRPDWWKEAAGSVADLGVLVPIAVGLIVLNGLSVTAVMLPAALLYFIVARAYALPIAVQPLKAFGAIAIAVGASSNVIAAGAILMGVTFTALGVSGTIDAIARRIPQSVVRGVQLCVAVLLGKVGVGIVAATPANFTHQWPSTISIGVAVVLLVGLWFKRGRLSLAAVALAVVAMAVAGGSSGTAFTFGPTSLTLPDLTLADFATALTLLVIPQLPLTFANSCLAPADAARQYFGDAARRVTPGRLAITLGAANIVAGGISGMPVCHGAGGLSAHFAFGARTWRAPVIIGSALLVVACVFGQVAGSLLPMFPVSLLAALLGVAAITHALLLRDVHGWRDWLVVLTVATLGVFANLAYGVVIGLLLAGVLARSVAPKPTS